MDRGERETYLEQRMIGKLIVSHGRLAEELLAAARNIAGEVTGFRALSLDWSEGCDEAEASIGREIAALDDGDGVLILTDMFGDTPCNAAVAHSRQGRVEIVSGVNLPMVVRLACASPEESDVAQLAHWIVSKGKAAIRDCTAARGPAPAAEQGECPTTAPAEGSDAERRETAAEAHPAAAGGEGGDGRR